MRYCELKTDQSTLEQGIWQQGVQELVARMILPLERILHNAAIMHWMIQEGYDD